MQLINIGFGNMISSSRLITIVSPESAPIKRIIQEARERGMLIDATYGRRTRAVIIMDTDHVILSAILPETVAGRLADNFNKQLFNKKTGAYRDGIGTDHCSFQYATTKQLGRGDFSAIPGGIPGTDKVYRYTGFTVYTVPEPRVTRSIQSP